MNVGTFLSEFTHIASAPNGTHVLRRMIYNLGISGTLCEQRGDEGTGNDLLERITTVREKMIRSHTFKRSPKLESVGDDFSIDLPAIPSSWTWTRLVDIGIVNPRNQADDDTLASFASMSAFSELHAVEAKPEIRPWSAIKTGFTHFADGDIVVAKITPCFENGKAAVIQSLSNGIGAGTTELHVFRPIGQLVLPRFVYLFLRSPYFRSLGQERMTGTAGQKRLSSEYFATRPFPLPPLEEQKRIIAKVDDLMMLCDQLERQQQQRRRLLPLLSKASYARLAETPTPANLAAIFTDPPSLSPKEMRKTILSLAVRGKLGTSEFNRLTAESFLESNDRSRQEIANLDRRVKSNREAPLSMNERWEIPANWSWAALADLVLFVDYRGKTPAKVSSGVRLVTAKNVRKWKVNRLPEEFISELEFDKWMTRGLPKAGDVLFTTEAPMGFAAVVNLDERFALAQRVICFQPFGGFNPHFAVLQILSEEFQAILRSNATGVTAQGIKSAKLRRLPFAVPPLREQHRIVSLVQKLLAIVDKVERTQQMAMRSSETFAKAAVAALTRAEIPEQQDMKAPKTELVTRLTAERKPTKAQNAPLAVILSESKTDVSAKDLWKKSGLEIDAFYLQLKTEMINGWIVAPQGPVVNELEAN